MRKIKGMLFACTKSYVLMTAFLSLFFSVCFGKVNALYGIPFPQGPGDLQIQTFFRWQLLMLPPLMAASEYLNNTVDMEVFIRVRIKNDRKFLQLQLSALILISVFWGLIVAFLGIITVQTGVLILLLTVLGQIMWMSLYLVLYFLGRSTAMALTSTVFCTAGMFFIGEIWNPYCRFLPTSWTMTCRSQRSVPNGVPLPIAMVGCTFFICMCMVIIYLMNQQRRIKI